MNNTENLYSQLNLKYRQAFHYFRDSRLDNSLLWQRLLYFRLLAFRYTGFLKYITQWSAQYPNRDFSFWHFSNNYLTLTSLDHTCSHEIKVQNEVLPQEGLAIIKRICLECRLNRCFYSHSGYEKLENRKATGAVLPALNCLASVVHITLLSWMSLMTINQRW